jgi:hypothetical protein
VTSHVIHVHCCDAHVMPGVLFWPEAYLCVPCLVLAGALKVAWLAALQILQSTHHNDSNQQCDVLHLVLNVIW